METSFGLNSVLPSSHSILPPEILLLILGNARITDLKNCRLVSSCWNQYGIHVLSKIHPLLHFSTPDSVMEFLAAMSVGPLPFSRFSFRSMHPQVVLDFLERHGSGSVRELHIDFPYKFCPYLQRFSPAAEGSTNAIQNISNVVFHQIPKLESLKLTMYKAILPTWDDFELVRYPHLKTLELHLVIRHVGPTEMERFIEEMIRRSPKLRQFKIRNHSFPHNPKYLDHLPKWLKKIPRHMEIGLDLQEVTDSVLPLLHSLMSEPINLVTLSIKSAAFEDATVSELFCKWLFQQTLKRIQFGHGIPWENQNEWNTFKECKELTIKRNIKPDENGRMMLRSFPNVTHVTLRSAHQEWFDILGTMLPCLKHLTCKSVPDTWEIVPGLTISKVCEIQFGLEVSPPDLEKSPFREQTALKILELEIKSLKVLLPIVYCSQEGMMPRLEKLCISLDYKREETHSLGLINKYGQTLSAYHESVLFVCESNPSLSLYFVRPDYH